MKKIFFSSVMLLFVVTDLLAGPNPIVNRLSQQEILECVTPSSIAYNYVIAILNKDYNRAISYMDIQSAESWREAGVDAINGLFSTPGKLNIHGWRPALLNGYEVTIAYVQDEWYYEENGSMYYNFDQVVKDGMIYLPGETTPRVGINQKKVYVTCSPSSEIGNVGFQDITRYGDTNVKVLLQNFNGVWRVIGFK
jgi:hypothetical protein